MCPGPYARSIPMPADKERCFVNERGIESGDRNIEVKWKNGFRASVDSRIGNESNMSFEVFLMASLEPKWSPW